MDANYENEKAVMGCFLHGSILNVLSCVVAMT